MLAAVIKRSKSQGVPKENIETALKKVCSCSGLSLLRDPELSQISGENGKGDTHLVFEAMGPGSVGLIV